MVKRFSFLIVVLLVCSFTLQAQLLSEDFSSVAVDEDIALDGWTNHAETGSRFWIGKEFDGEKYAQMSSFNSDEENVVWLVTPGINLDNSTDESFTFNVKVGFWAHAGLTIHISTDYDGSNVGNATWEDITGNFTIPVEPTGGYGEFVSAGTMNLSSYSGTVNIAFKYSGNSASATTTFQIDDIILSGTVGVNDIVASSKIFPNPANSVLNISNDEIIAGIKVFNAAGQKVLDVDVNSNNYSLEIENLTKGVYFVNILDTEGNSNVTKFVKK